MYLFLYSSTLLLPQSQAWHTPTGQVWRSSPRVGCAVSDQSSPKHYKHTHWSGLEIITLSRLCCLRPVLVLMSMRSCTGLSKAWMEKDGVPERPSVSWETSRLSLIQSPLIPLLSVAFRPRSGELLQHPAVVSESDGPFSIYLNSRKCCHSTSPKQGTCCRCLHSHLNLHKEGVAGFQPWTSLQTRQNNPVQPDTEILCCMRPLLHCVFHTVVNVFSIKILPSDFQYKVRYGQFFQL